MPLFSAQDESDIPSSSKPIFCTSRLLRQDMSGSTHISPAAFVSRNTAASVLMPLRSRYFGKTARPSIITLSPVGSCKSAFLKNSSFKQSPSVARPFKNLPLHRFFCQPPQKQFPNLKSPLLHHLFGTRLVRRKHTLSTDAACTASSENIVRNSNLSSSFYFFIYYNTLLKISHVIHSCTLCRHITQQQIFFLNCSILSEEIQGKRTLLSVPVCLFTPNILNYTQTCHYIITGSTKRHISVL